MAIQLKPEIEEIIRQDVQRGPYESVEEFVEHAVTLLHEQEAWLAENRTEISALIEEGWLSAERGELIDSDQVVADLQKRKLEWLKQHPEA